MPTGHWPPPGWSQGCHGLWPSGSKHIEGSKELKERRLVVATGTSPGSNGRILDKRGLWSKADEGRGEGPFHSVSLLSSARPLAYGSLLIFRVKGAKLATSSTQRSGNSNRSVKDLPKMTPAKC